MLITRSAKVNLDYYIQLTEMIEPNNKLIDIIVQLPKQGGNYYFRQWPLTLHLPALYLPGYDTATLGSHMALVNSFPWSPTPISGPISSIYPISAIPTRKTGMNPFRWKSGIRRAGWNSGYSGGMTFTCSVNEAYRYIKSNPRRVSFVSSLKAPLLKNTRLVSIQLLTVIYNFQ